MRYATFIAFLTLLCLSIGCNQDQSPAPRQRPCSCGVTNWSRFSAESSGFSAFMPTQPRHSLVTNETVAGPLVMSVLISEMSSTVAFSIVRNSFPTNMVMTNTAAIFAGGLKQALGTDGSLTSEREVALGGYPGREWCFEKDRGRTILTMRVYLVDHDLYQAICVMPKRRLCQRHVAEFLDSCELRRE